MITPSEPSQSDLMAKLREAVKAAGSKANLARQAGISASYISDILRGHRKISGKKILAVLGLKKVIIRKMVNVGEGQEELKS